MPAPVSQFTTIPRSKLAMDSQAKNSDAASTFSESTTYSYEKTDAVKSESKKLSFGQRLKNSFKDKEVGHTDAVPSQSRPLYGIYGNSPFTDNRPRI